MEEQVPRTEEQLRFDSDLIEMQALIEKMELYEVEWDLRKYIPLAWPIIEPNKPYVPGWHIDAIADHLMACTEGHIQKLVINIPPRHMKSLTVSVFWPSWEWIRFPQTKWLFVSYARNLVIRDAVKSRRIIQSDWYRGIWGDRYKLAGDQNVKSYFENNQGGARIVGSIDAGITGEGGDRLVVDDPLKLEDAENQNAILKLTIIGTVCLPHDSMTKLGEFASSLCSDSMRMTSLVTSYEKAVGRTFTSQQSMNQPVGAPHTIGGLSVNSNKKTKTSSKARKSKPKAKSSKSKRQSTRRSSTRGGSRESF
jgi:hypothetical protein